MKTGRMKIRKEIRANLRDICLRTTIIASLLKRFILNSGYRTEKKSFEEYDKFWNKFWDDKDYLRLDLSMRNRWAAIEQNISPLEFKRNGIVQIIKEKLVKYNVTSVLEIGSGAGLNLLFLAPLFPEIQFVGLEPTNSGVEVSNRFIKSPPEEFQCASELGSIHNIKIIKGSILDIKTMDKLKEYNFDLIFTCAVLEQLNNFIEIFFTNISTLKFKHFLFYEEWLEANLEIRNYQTLVDADYFRESLSVLDQFSLELMEFSIPVLQLSGLAYGVAFGKKLENTYLAR